MKKSKEIETEVGPLTIPRNVRHLIEVKKLPDDNGSNLMEGYNEKMGPTDGWLGKMFKGYESQGRTPFTREDVEKFIVLCAENPKMKERFSYLLIVIMGQFEMDEPVVEEPVVEEPVVEEPIPVYINRYADADELALLH